MLSYCFQNPVVGKKSLIFYFTWIILVRALEWSPYIYHGFDIFIRFMFFNLSGYGPECIRLFRWLLSVLLSRLFVVLHASRMDLFFISFWLDFEEHFWGHERIHDIVSWTSLSPACYCHCCHWIVFLLHRQPWIIPCYRFFLLCRADGLIVPCLMTVSSNMSIVTKIFREMLSPCLTWQYCNVYIGCNHFLFLLPDF